MPDFDKLANVYRAWEKRLAGMKFCIAGGAVRDAFLGRDPKDYDVFVLGRSGIEKERFLGLEPVTQFDWHLSEPFLEGSFLIDGKIHQVMGAKEFCDVKSLLHSFDWNVSLFAFDSSGVTALENADNIAPGKPLVINRITYPMSSLRRGFRYSERFGMVFEKDDIQLLAGLITANALRSALFNRNKNP